MQVAYIFILIVRTKICSATEAKVNFGIGLFIHELLREPLITYEVLLFKVLLY